MKFIHLADLHLGKNVNDFSMIEDQKYILNKIIELVERESADAVILAGDIYDRQVPSEEAVKVLDNFITQLSSMGKKVFAVSGNHDSDERLNFASRLLQAKGIYIAGRYDGKIECIDVKDEHGPLHIWMMPYVKASRVAHFYHDADTSTYDAAFRAALSDCAINPEERNVMIAHQFVTSLDNEPELAGSETIMMNVGTLDRIGADCFDQFDYVALGHIHGCQQIGRETCRYAGSPLKYSLNEREINSEKTVPVITLNAKGDIDVKLHHLKPLREVRHIKGTLTELMRNAVDTDDYIYATLTDEEVQLDAMSRIQEVYPNVMKLDYDNKATRHIAENESFAETEGKSFDQLVSDFFQTFHGYEPGEKEWKIIEEAAKEAGVIQ